MKTIQATPKVIISYPIDYFKEQGRLGGLKTLKRHGKKHYKKIGKKRLDKGVV